MKEKQIKGLILEAENGDTLYFDKSMIVKIAIVTKGSHILYNKNGLREYEIANVVKIELNKSANNRIVYGDFEKYMDFDPFERIVSYGDVTYITIVYDDSSLRKFYTIYDEDTNGGSGRNLLETDTYDNEGNLIISIKPKGE